MKRKAINDLKNIENKLFYLKNDIKKSPPPDNYQLLEIFFDLSKDIEKTIKNLEKSPVK
jgi:hypothetical protein